MNKIAEDLARIDTLAGLSEEDRTAVAGICEPAAFDAGTILAREGVDAGELFAVLEGAIGIWVDYGTEHADLLAVTESPCLVGEMSVADELPRSATMVARNRVVCYSIDADAFRSLLGKRGSIALALMRGISRIVRSSNDSFVSELRGRNEELTRANQELKEAQRQLVRQERLSSLGKFSSMIIHDLRNPLSVIKGYADMLALKLETRDGADDLLRYASQIRRETSRLTGLTNEWLDYSRGEIRLGYSPIGFEDFCSQVRENVQSALDAKDIATEWDIRFGSTVLLDVDRMLRVMINVVDNARKACSRGGRIRISAAEEQELLCISVEDNGIGMDAEAQAHIFDPFYSKSERGGTGLGMHIVKTVVNAHDGSVTVKSSPGSGTAILIRLPLRH